MNTIKDFINELHGVIELPYLIMVDIIGLFRIGFTSEKFAKDFIKQVEYSRQRISSNHPECKQKIWHSIKNFFPKFSKYIYIEELY